MDRSREPAIRLCGRFEVMLGGRRITPQLPGRQGRLVLAYLACNRRRPVPRDELIELLWPIDPPAHPEEVLGALLSKLRRALGAGVLDGRRELTLTLPAGASIDLELAATAIEQGESALAAGEARTAWEQAQAALELTEGGFLPGFDSAWACERRRAVEELRLRTLECVAGAGVLIGGAECSAAERAARELIAAAPLREPGYRLLMQTLAARGDVAQALEAYEALRVRLRDELGITPSAAVRAEHERLLTDGNGESGPPSLTPSAAEDRPRPAARPREERKLVTVLAGTLEDGAPSGDPERLSACRAWAYERIRAELNGFGATVRLTADGVVLALFGAPIAHEDDAERAVRAAVHLRDLGLLTRAAVVTGEVLVALEAAAVSSATGRAVDDAIRIARAAGPGEVLAGAVTVRATHRAVAYDTRRPDAIWRVRAVNREHTAALEHPPRAQLVGRVRELGLLESLCSSVVEEGRPRLVTIVGQAGVGKSRLIDEFITRIDAPSTPIVYRGRCLAYGEGTTYWALQEILWQATGIAFDDPAAAAARRLRQRVRAVVGAAQADRVGAALAVAAGIALPENPVERMSPEAVASEIALAWPAFLSALAAAAPLVVVIEDVHWAEPPLLEMLERVLARSTGRLFLVATARPEFADGRPAWSSRPGISQIAIDPLTDDQTRALVAELLPREGAQVRECVVAAAEGNPFFAEQLASHISEKTADATPIPNTVRALLAARIDVLPETEKRLLQDAAVVGRVFWTTTLQSVQPRPDLQRALEELEDRGLIVTRPASSLPGETEFSFCHGLTREVAYRSIPRSKRCRAHAAVGRWLEQLAGDRREEFVDLLAYHYEAAAAPGDAALAWPAASPERAQLQAKAVTALLDAGDAARKRVSLEQALRYAHRARALAASDNDRLGALELEARTCHAALHGDEALSAYTAAMELARAVGDSVALARLRAHATLLCVRYSGTLTGESWRTKARELVEQEPHGYSEDATFERGALLVARAWHRSWLGQSDLETARSNAERAIAIAETIDSPELIAAAVEALTWLAFEDGFCQANTMGERLVRAARSWPDRVEAHESLVTAAMAFCWAGKFDRAASVARKATARAAQLSGHRVLHSAAAETLWLVPTGRFAELGRSTSRVLELAREEGQHICGTATMALAGRVLWLFETGRPDDAARALELFERLRSPHRVPLYDYITGQLLRPVVGVKGMTAMLEQFQAPRHDGEAIMLLRLQLPILALAGAHEELDAAIANARLLAKSGCAPALGSIADWAAAAQTATDNPAEALARALAAATALTQHGEPYTAARLLADFLAFADGSDVRTVAQETAAQLHAMGAFGSAAELHARAQSQSAPRSTAIASQTPRLKSRS